MYLLELSIICGNNYNNEKVYNLTLTNKGNTHVFTDTIFYLDLWKSINNQELYNSVSITASWYEKWSVAASIVKKKKHLKECLLVLQNVKVINILGNTAEIFHCSNFCRSFFSILYLVCTFYFTSGPNVNYLPITFLYSRFCPSHPAFCYVPLKNT